MTADQIKTLKLVLPEFSRTILLLVSLILPESLISSMSFFLHVP